MPPSPSLRRWSGPRLLCWIAASALLLLAPSCGEDDDAGAPTGAPSPLPDLPDLITPRPDDPDGGAIDLEHLGDALYSVPVLHVDLPEADLLALLQNPQRRDDLPVTVRFQGRTWEGAALELHGGFARSVPKRSFRLRFPDDNPLWLAFDGPLEGHHRVVLQASWIDPTFQRNRLTFDAVRALGGIAPRATWVALAFNGRLYGLFLLLERVDATFLTRRDLDPAGSLYKAENHAANWAWREDVLAGYAVQLHEGRPPHDLNDLLRRVTSTPAAEADFAREVEPALDLQDVLIWQLVHTYAQNKDTFTKNYYLYHDTSPDAPFRLISWDADATWGMNWDGAPLPADSDAWYGTDRFAPRLLSIPAWRQRYTALARDALQGDLHPDRLLDSLDAHDTLRPLLDLDARLWPRGRGTDAELEALREAIQQRQERLLEALPE